MPAVPAPLANAELSLSDAACGLCVVSLVNSVGEAAERRQALVALVDERGNHRRKRPAPSDPP